MTIQESIADTKRKYHHDGRQPPNGIRREIFRKKTRGDGTLIRERRGSKR